MSNWLYEIKGHGKKRYSQCGEEGFLEFILHNLGIDIAGMTLIEFGAADGKTLSNSRYFIEKGATFALYDGNPGNSEDVIDQWIDLDFAKICAKQFERIDLFLIDLDGNDYYILDEFLTELAIEDKPKIVVCEINPVFEKQEKAVMAYNANHLWDGTTYYGMSLAASKFLMDYHGYELVYLNQSLNAFYIRKDLIKGLEVPEVEYKRKYDHPHGDGPWMAPVTVDTFVNLNSVTTDENNHSITDFAGDHGIGTDQP